MSDTVWSEDPTLWDISPPRAGDPETSRWAADDARLTAGKMRALALQTLIIWMDGLTDFELSDITGCYKPSIGKRRTELTQHGLVEWSGRWRPAPSGSRARVWQVTALGRLRWQKMAGL